MNSVTSSGSHSPPKLRSNACAPHPSPHANASVGGCMRVRGGVRCLNGCGCGCGGMEVLQCAGGAAGQRIGDGDLCGVTAVAYRFAALGTRSCCSLHGACGLCLPHQHCPCITQTLLRGLSRTDAWPMTATVDFPSTERGREVLSCSLIDQMPGGLWGRWYPGIQVATSDALGVARSFCAFAAAGDRGMRMRVSACLWVCVHARWAWRVWRACSARWPWMCSTCCACIHCWRRRWCFCSRPASPNPCNTNGIFRFQARWGSESPSAAPNHAMTMALHAHRSELSFCKPDFIIIIRDIIREICKRFATHH